MMRRILKDKRRIALPLAIAAVANLLALALVVYPLSRRVAGADARAAQAKQALTTATAANRAAQATLEGRERTDKQLVSFYSEVLPPNLPAARRMTYLRLAQLAQEANLEYSNRSFAPEHEKDSTLARMDMNIALEGGYRDIRQFIHTLETAPEFVIIRAVALTQATEDAAQQKSSSTGPRRLTVNLTLATYYRADDEQR